MSKFDHVHPPQNFARHHKTLLVVKHYTFTCDNRIYFSETNHIDLEDHTYHLEMEVWSKTDDHGLAVDFNVIDDIYKQYLQPYLDGQLLNDTLPDMNTTVENIAHWIWLRFSEHLPEDVSMNSIALYETPDQGIRLTRNIMAQ
ncbi:6-pyruvoyl trahydropterin synthase family protein [Staphylococcus canis]|uniref:6-carboxy-5,6,7,8-tetrahydropterin synthase n=1 Tax=Staphylococcus canis TaxID=2724942 RepID=A0ABS0T7J5_9STAP|nr:6-carboxytetrahydropterin synthase [Staphylococcus canis]MBI5974377.1 6-pyruvoyl tetrahydrobiopterin synthase [Staphylococcus canis]